MLPIKRARELLNRRDVEFVQSRRMYTTTAGVAAGAVYTDGVAITYPSRFDRARPVFVAWGVDEQHAVEVLEAMMANQEEN